MTDSLPHRSDLDLVRAVLEGDAGAALRLARRMNCVPRILAAQNARMGRPLDEHDLDDLSQDVLILIWRKLDQFEGRAPVEGWVYRVCCLELMNMMRRKRRRMGPRENVPEGVSTELAARQRVDPWEYEDVYLALDWLGAPEADVIRLKHFDELTFTEIGERVGISPNTAKTWYYRGLSSLQGYLETKTHREGIDGERTSRS